MERLTLNQLLQGCKGTLVKNCNSQVDAVSVEGISIDSRSVQRGDLFIPIRGDTYDGHQFIQQAYEKGALGCITQEEVAAIPQGKFAIQVEDTNKALKDLAEYYVSLFDIPVVGVTGSVGKTSTKDMIASVIGEAYSVLKTEGNYNNEIGLPLTVFQLTNNHQAAVLEMGMSSFGEIHSLSKIARPKIGVITNIGYSHIENLGSQEGILKAKSEIFDFVHPMGIAILNADDPLLYSLKQSVKHKIIWIGIDNTEGYYASDIQYMDMEGVSCIVHTPHDSFTAFIPSPGKHMVYNALVAVAVGDHLGLSIQQIQAGLRKFVPSKMRMAVSTTKHPITIINDVYNASPSSMSAAIEVLLSTSSTKRKVAILGDMLEMGTFCEEAHRELGIRVVNKGVDVLLCVGLHAKHIYQAALQYKKTNQEIYYFETQEELHDCLHTVLKKQDIVLVKASRGMQLEQTIDKMEKVEL